MPQDWLLLAPKLSPALFDWACSIELNTEQIGAFIIILARRKVSAIPAYIDLFTGH